MLGGQLNMTNTEMTVALKKRVEELEKQLDGLRLSRRVLMNLLEQVEKEKNELAQALERKNQSQNRRSVRHLHLNR
jgi:prefoldin subunit 5